jgi:hypothetical protein
LRVRALTYEFGGGGVGWITGNHLAQNSHQVGDPHFPRELTADRLQLNLPKDLAYPKEVAFMEAEREV